jgi:hypothetical protein
MHKKLLVDDTGIWVGQTPEEAESLAQYVEMHRRDKSMRVPNRAYDTMVVQLATSTFIPRQVTQMAALQTAAHYTKAQETPDVGPWFQSREEAEVHLSSNASTPPPQYHQQAQYPQEAQQMQYPQQQQQRQMPRTRAYAPEMCHAEGSAMSGYHAYQQQPQRRQTPPPAFAAYESPPCEYPITDCGDLPW